MDLTHLDWPFFDPVHRTLAERAVRFDCGPLVREDDIDRRCRSLVRTLGDSGLLRYCVPGIVGITRTKQATARWRSLEQHAVAPPVWRAIRNAVH